MRGGREVWVVVGHLCECKASLVVDFEDLLDGVDVGGRPKVQTQVVLACCAHDLLGRKKRKLSTTFLRLMFKLEHRLPTLAYKGALTTICLAANW